ncbi:hypothetical protein [Pseudosporangium ferrugineum]|uniref:hypothetical protein n=1 Tax=Pseudosporangium ferrugineum TaxID=439699 RepID=UPI000D04C2D4|nr:hypothetical protein [Pseudosporangium ferrugineum]
MNTLGDDIAGSPAQPLTGAEVSDRLSATGTAPPAASAPATPTATTPTATGPVTTAPVASKSAQVTRTRAFGRGGSTLMASCTGDRATLLSWSPEQGYAASPIEKGPARKASIRFSRSGGGGGRGGGPPAVRLDITCVDGTPEENVQVEGGYPEGRWHR